MASISDLLGKTLTRVERDGAGGLVRVHYWSGKRQPRSDSCYDAIHGDSILFTTADGTQYAMHHVGDCCESVDIEDINGDLQDLVGSPILQAEEVVSTDPQPGQEVSDYESFTWTFYKLATAKGYVTIRWYGSSNGYYSESVDFDEVEA